MIDQTAPTAPTWQQAHVEPSAATQAARDSAAVTKLAPKIVKAAEECRRVKMSDPEIRYALNAKEQLAVMKRVVDTAEKASKAYEPFSHLEHQIGGKSITKEAMSLEGIRRTGDWLEEALFEANPLFDVRPRPPIFGR